MVVSIQPRRTLGVAPNRLLPHSFEQHDRNGSREVQAARAAHRNSNRALGICRKERLRQPFGFPAENEEIAVRERHIVVGPLRFRGDEEPARVRFSRLQLRQRIPDAKIDLFPIIETGPLQLPIVQREAERLDEVQRRTRRETEAADVAGIRRNLRLNENDVERQLQLARDELLELHNVGRELADAFR